jgi:hypothetical protein
MVCKKCAEGGCGCGTKKAEFNNEATVQEPDWIPDGDGRAIGQQDFAINLSPLHADTVGSPSPTFNEDITGQDGPSDSPTNSTFEARNMNLAPSSRDVKFARQKIEDEGFGDIYADCYMVNQQVNKKGKKQNRFYYTAVTNKGNRWYALGAHGGIEAAKSPDGINLFNIAGGKSGYEVPVGSMASAQAVCKEKQDAKIHRNTPKNYRKVTHAEISDAETFGSDTLAEIEGPTAEATSGGLHAPSSFAMTWEDGAGYSSASIPPNEIAWAEGKSTSWMTWACGIALVLAGGSFLKAKMSEQKAENVLKNAVSKRKGCCGGSKKTPSKGAGIQNSLDGGVTFQSEFSVGHINPVEVEGQNDVYGAEDYRLSTPQVSQPNWGPQKTYRQNQRNNLKMW